MFAAVSTHTIINAYNFPITNNTNKTLIIQAELQGDKTPYFFYTKPGATADFKFNNATPLSLIKYIIVTDRVSQVLTRLNAIKDGVVIHTDKLLDWAENQSTNPRITPTITNKLGRSDVGIGGIKTFTTGYKFSVEDANNEIIAYWNLVQ